MAHRLSKITISNFKSIVLQEFELSDYTPLIGYNNAGKTNILQAIKWLFRRSSLTEQEFNIIESPVVVGGYIEGISDEILERLPANHKSSIRPFIQDEKIRIQRCQNKPNESTTTIKLFVFDPTIQDWKANPTGIENALSALFPEPIHVGAMENSEEDVSKYKSTTTIGKLLSEIIEPIENRNGQQVKAILSGLKKMFDADGEERAPELRNFDEEVNKKIDTFFPDVTIKIHVPTPELKEVFNKATIKVYEDASPQGRDVSVLGHGAQRSIQMALIRQLAELKRTSEERSTTTLLLIDEPELYLHPQAVEVIREALKTLSLQGYQIVFTTHSALMITQKDVGNTILVRKAIPIGTHKMETMKTAIPMIEQQAANQLSLMFSLSNSTQILFSERVILTEGKTEEKILPKLIESITGKSIGLWKYALIKQDGVTNTKKSMRVLDVMGLASKAIVDLDYIKHAVVDGYLNCDDSDIIMCKNIFREIAKDEKIKLSEDGWPKKNEHFTASKAFELLAQQEQITRNIENLHQKLLLEGIWIWKKGSIEKHLGLNGKKENILAMFVNKIETIPLQDVIDDLEEVKKCVDWLVS